jgi:hypothetical protein
MSRLREEHQAPMSRLREEHQAPMSRLREEHQAPMSRLREEHQYRPPVYLALPRRSRYPQAASAAA